MIEWVFAPFSIGMLTPIVFFIIPFVTTFTLGLSLTTSFFSLCYFLYYDWIHLSHHVDEYIPPTKWGKILKKSHTWHHYKNENLWWGVTNIFGDIIFGTRLGHKDVKPSDRVRNIW